MSEEFSWEPSTTSTGADRKTHLEHPPQRWPRKSEWIAFGPTGWRSGHTQHPYFFHHGGVITSWLDPEPKRDKIWQSMMRQVEHGGTELGSHATCFHHWKELIWFCWLFVVIALMIGMSLKICTALDEYQRGLALVGGCSVLHPGEAATVMGS